MANNIAVQQDTGQIVQVATIETGGVHTLVVTTAAANSSITLLMPTGQFMRIGTVLSGGVHTIAVTT